VDTTKEPLFAEERKQKILDIVKQSEKVTVDQLCALFNVSSSTIRNDLRELENLNLLRRTHGGAIKSKAGYELDTKTKEGQNQNEKGKIGDFALNMIDDGDTILLDTGTTTMELAKRLSVKDSLTVVTNDIQIAGCLENFENINIIFIGGVIRKKYHCTVGTWGSKMLSEITVDKAFMGANGISTKKGASTPDIYHAEIKRSMISIANKIILLCDSSKVGRNSFVQFAGLQQIDTIITDEGIDKDDKVDFESNGIEVLIAE
jgi:DeoR family fructose operon transcriptional repressor